MTVRLALLSYWHVHAKDYEREARAHPDVELTVIWDEDAARGKAKAEEIGARFEPDLAVVLADPEIDGVIVTTATAEHHRVIMAAAKAGKQIFTEKVIAATSAEAEEIVQVIEQQNVSAAVCLPRLSNGYTQAILGLIEAGELGHITYGRMRVGHDGAVPTDDAPDGWLPSQFFNLAEAQGGALIDFGAHPLYLLRTFMGMPDSISAQFGYATGHMVEDHAVVTFGYSSGALAVAEVSFLDNPGTFEIELHGEKASLRYAAPDLQLMKRSATDHRRTPSAWEIVDQIPGDLPSPFEQWIAHVQAGTRSPENLKLGLELTQMAEAANRSAREGIRISLGE